jgi:hypothetical protein
MEKVEQEPADLLNLDTSCFVSSSFCCTRNKNSDKSHQELESLKSNPFYSQGERNLALRFRLRVYGT